MLAWPQKQLLNCSRGTGRYSLLKPTAAVSCNPVRPATLQSRRTICSATGKRSGKGADGSDDSNGALQDVSLSGMITTKIRDADTLPEVEDILNEWGGSFSYINAAAAFTRAGNLAQKRPAAATRLLNRLASVWESVLPDAGPQALANVLWASGKLKYSNAQLWSNTLAEFMQQVQQGKSQNACFDIANVMHGMANVALANKGEVPGVHRSDVTEAVCEMLGCMRVLATAPVLEGVNPQDISNTLWACAKLRINPGSAAVKSLVQAISRSAMLEKAVPQNISNTLWAASSLRQECDWQSNIDQRVWQRLLGEDQLPRIANRGQPHEVSNVLLALGGLSVPTATSGPAVPRDFAQQCALQLLQGNVARQLSAWTPQALSNSMWACAKLDVLDVAFWDRAAAAAPAWLPVAGAVDLRQLAWACAKLQFKHQQLMAGMLKRTKQLALEKQQQYRQQSLLRDTHGVIIGVTHAVAMLDMQQLAGDARDLVANSGVTAADANNRAPALASMLWDVHAWLVQHQLLDGQGLAGLLSEQQLAEGKAASNAYYLAQEQQQQPV